MLYFTGEAIEDDDDDVSEFEFCYEMITFAGMTEVGRGWVLDLGCTR